MQHVKYFLCCVGLVFCSVYTHAQDTILHKKNSLHWQATVIPQYHPVFTSPYTGENSLLPKEGVKTSFTVTLFYARRIGKNSLLVFNPEVAGGKGLSKTLGVAGFPNGEIYRVGDPRPKPYVARLYVEHRFPLSKVRANIADDINMVAHDAYRDYISVLAGKFSLTDFFDNSFVATDPRTQFFNWTFMGSGAFDYPANTRGYTFGLMSTIKYKNTWIRLATTTVPTEANGTTLQWKAGKAMGLAIELEQNNLFREQKNNTTLHAGIFLNKARMGNYIKAIRTAPAGTIPDITATRIEGRTKWGWYISLDRATPYLDYFIRYSRNDGRNETWAFTEIDRSITMGIALQGKLWARQLDELGIALGMNSLSRSHRQYLAAGGTGFMLGDGRLNFGQETIGEMYYRIQCTQLISISPDYQFIVNPGYNKDRGPVHVFALRLHLAM